MEWEIDTAALVEEFRARVAALEAELVKSERGLEFTRSWYAVRIARLTQLAKEREIWPEAAAILANGAADREPPTYAQLLNGERHRVDRAEASLAAERAGADALAEALAKVYPYAESRAEDLSVDDDDSSRTFDRANKALDEARAVLAAHASRRGPGKP